MGWLCGGVDCIARTQAHSSTGYARSDPTPAAKSCAGFPRSPMNPHMGRELRKNPSHPSGFACLKAAETSAT